MMCSAMLSQIAFRKWFHQAVLVSSSTSRRNYLGLIRAHLSDVNVHSELQWHYWWSLMWTDNT